MNEVILSVFWLPLFRRCPLHRCRCAPPGPWWTPRPASPEVTRLQGDREHLFARLTALHDAGLPLLETLGLARLRTGGDYTFLARACGIPEGDARAFDVRLAHFVKHIVGPEAWTEEAERRVFMPMSGGERGSDGGGLGFQSVELTAPGANAASW